MRIKSYFVNSVEEAMLQARRELGADAMLLNSRRLQPDAGASGRYEVVFGVALEPEADPSPDRSVPPSSGVLLHELEELRQELSALKDRIRRPPDASAVTDIPEMLALYHRLIDAELSDELATGIVTEVGSAISPQEQDPRLRRAAAAPGLAQLDEAVRSELLRRTLVDSSQDQPGGGQRTITLVGPPGAGKTTSLAKMAVRLGIERRRSVGVIAVDPFRAAGTEQLRALTAILGLAFFPVDHLAQFTEALRRNDRKDLLFVDTPGFSPADMAEARDLALCLAPLPDAAVHLVLPASMKASDLRKVVDRYALFRPNRILATRLDEAGSIGPIFSESLRLGTPVSFLCGGQSIPEDLAPATAAGMVDLVLQPERITAQFAA